MDLGSEADKPTRDNHSTRILGAGGDAWHPNRGQHTVHEKRPGGKANEAIMRKPARCDTCFAEADARDSSHSERIKRRRNAATSNPTTSRRPRRSNHAQHYSPGGAPDTSELPPPPLRGAAGEVGPDEGDP